MNAIPDHAPDGMTLLEVIRRMEKDGYEGQLAASHGCAVRCFTCRRTSPPVEVAVDRIWRTEGPSDPDDMVAVAAVRCPHCATKGTLALKYGPGATPEEAEILANLDDADREMFPVTANGA